MFLTSNNDRNLEKGIIKICLILWQRVAVATRDYYVCIIIAIFLLPPFFTSPFFVVYFLEKFSQAHCKLSPHSLAWIEAKLQSQSKLVQTTEEVLFEMHIDKFVTCFGTRTIAGKLNCNPNGICREMQFQFR